MSNHNRYVNKPCETCAYIMRRVTSRRRWCSRCLALRLAARTTKPSVIALRRRLQIEREAVALARVIDEQILAPSRYWEIGEDPR